MKTQNPKPKTGLQKALHRLLWGLVYALPAVLFFSYYPIISLGSNSSMNFELSLPLLWLVLFDLVAFLLLGFNRKSWRTNLPGISDRRFFLFALFPFYATLSIFWSANPVRAILTAGIIWLLFFAVFAIIFLLPLFSPPKSFRRHLLATFFVSTAIICLFCFLQSILDACGISREHTLLCAGCTSYSFGFPHPSGFAIEPQFMGNLLLAPTLTAFYLLIFGPKWQRTGDNGASGDTSSVKRLSATNEERTKCRLARNDGPSQTGRVRKKYWLLVALCTLFSTTLFFTFSRGAIYAYAVALLVLLIFSLARHHFRWSLITIPVLTFLLSLGLQGTFSALGPTSETFMGGVTKSIHQLSLGLIDLRGLAKAPETSSDASNLPEGSPSPSENAPSASLEASEAPSNHNPDQDGSSATTPLETAPDAPESSIFEGYVPESTNVRLDLNRAALDTWLSAPGHPESGLSVGLRCHPFLSGTGPTCTASAPLTPTSVLFGVGLGGAGTALYRNRWITNIGSPKEIVQNQFFSLLLELGLVGILLALFSLLLAFVPNIFPKKFIDGRAANLQPSASPKNLQTPAHSATPVSSRPATSSKLFQNPFFQNPALPLLTALIIAYLISLNFFSGLPNALHIYLLPPLLFFVFTPTQGLAPAQEVRPSSCH